MARDQRRLVAIVSADVAGYSRLMGRDDSAVLAALKAHRRELIDPKIAEYAGRIVKTIGDGLLLEFPSVVDAVRCAIEVQRGMADRNAGVPGDQRIEFRVGINIGDIIIDDDDIHGDGVNVAARLQASAEPGGLCISAVVRDQLQEELRNEFADMGEQLFKNIDRPIRAYRRALAGTFAGATPPLQRRITPSIAVLPFVNRSHDEEDEYFSDGLADELLNVLAKIRGLQVAARSSAFTFKGKGATVAEVGRTLNVATVLEGSVRKAGNRMRISVQLVNVTDGYHLWSESYDRTLEDIFAVQDDIAQSVVRELRSRLLSEADDAGAAAEATTQVAAAMKGRATDAEAHRLYLQARHFLARNNREDQAKAIEYLKQALDRDPKFALAWAELSLAYSNEAALGWASVVTGYGRAREAAARALALEPELAEAHAQMALIQRNYDWDWRGAEASFGRALELAPGNAVVLRQVGRLAASLGRLDEAIGLYRRAIEQDPLSAAAYASLGLALDEADRLAEAEQAYRKALELAPQRTLVHAGLGLNLLAQGRGDEALDEAQREPELWRRLWALTIIHHASGRGGEADAALDELIAKHAEDAAFQIAIVYATRGEMDFAFEWLERAYLQRDTGLSQMKPSQLLRPLHADPRWNALLRKMGLAD
ncbi:MAG TPA: tetratricopeptide repeat protein [Steroidobacteraceae bacterium]